MNQSGINSNQTSLRGFWALIVTQFQGAFSDNALKTLVTFIGLAAAEDGALRRGDPLRGDHGDTRRRGVDRSQPPAALSGQARQQPSAAAAYVEHAVGM